ncbi:MAG: DUF1467 family protein, partial [Alphaproteobacteria bacterium]
MWSGSDGSAPRRRLEPPPLAPYPIGSTPPACAAGAGRVEHGLGLRRPWWGGRGVEMNWFTGLMVYVILWWLVWFVMLPIGVKVPDEVEKGHAPSAPANPNL